MSIPYTRVTPEDNRLAPLASRRPDVDPLAFVPVGRTGLRDLIDGGVDAGLSKFVVRPLAPVASWAERAAWLSDAIPRPTDLTPGATRGAVCPSAVGGQLADYVFDVVEGTIGIRSCDHQTLADRQAAVAHHREELVVDDSVAMGEHVSAGEVLAQPLPDVDQGKSRQRRLARHIGSRSPDATV